MQPRRALEDAAVIGLVEVLEHAHIRHRVERRAAREHQPVGPGFLDQAVDDVNQRVLEHHLDGRRLVQPVLRIGVVLYVLDPQHGVRIPHVFRRNRAAR